MSLPSPSTSIRLKIIPGVVLTETSEQIRGCYQHAQDWAQQAAAQTDRKLKEDFLDMERRWLTLARSCEFTERLTDFSDETKRQADKLPPLEH